MLHMQCMLRRECSAALSGTRLPSPLVQGAASSKPKSNGGQPSKPKVDPEYFI